MIHGAVFKVSTRCHTESAAVAQLRRFEANPSAYRADGASVGELAARLTEVAGALGVSVVEVVRRAIHLVPR